MELQARELRYEVFTVIEVTNEPNIWAIELKECKPTMKPDKVNFAMIHNDVSNEGVIYVDCTLSENKPEKTIDGVNGSISDDFIQVGCWRRINPKK